MTPGPATTPTVRVLDSVRFVFDEQEWKTNCLIGVVFLFIPIVGPIALAGWLCEIHQRLVRGHPQPVPKLDFSDLGHFLGRGVSPFLVQLVLSVPISIMIVGGYLVAAFGSLALIAATGEPLLGLVLVLLVVACVSVLSLLLGVVMNAAFTRAELTESFGDALSLRPLLQYTRMTWLQVLVKTILFGFVGMGVMFVGMALFCVGIYPAAIVLQIAAMHLRWQIYRYHVDRGGEPIAVKEPQVLPSEATRPHHGYRPPAGTGGHF
jgi:hypothetical protein